MTTTTTPLPAELATAAPAPRSRAAARQRDGRLHQLLELTKFRLNSLVLVTAGIGYLVAAKDGIVWSVLAWTLVGTWLLASGAAALNQVIEVDRDARMERTRRRPLPMRQMSRMQALLLALVMVFGGYTLLSGMVNVLVAFLGLANVVVYVAFYTPLKTRTTLNTLVGAICGGIPPMMGWAAATGHLAAGAWLLGAVLFIWQIPHFLALAWLYRDDYIRGGYRMLSAKDQTGHLTGLLAVLYTLALLPLGPVIALKGVAGWAFALASLPLGGMLLVLAVNMARRRTRSSARRLFLGSIIYLPLVMVLMVADAGPRFTATPPSARTVAPVATILQAP